MSLDTNVAKGAWIFQKNFFISLLFIIVIGGLALKGLLDITWAEIPEIAHELWANEDQASQ